MAVKQLSVFVENKPGRLSEIISAIGDNGLDIRGMSLSDTTNFGILRIIVDDPEKGEKALTDAGMTASVTEVIAVGIADRPGGLSEVLKLLNSENISVEYVYAFISREIKTAYVIIRVDDNDRAEKILREKGVSVLTDKDIRSM